MRSIEEGDEDSRCADIISSEITGDARTNAAARWLTRD
jgi:hypothetical protein